MTLKKRKYKGIEDLYALEDRMRAQQKVSPDTSKLDPTVNEQEERLLNPLQESQPRIQRSVEMLEELERLLTLIPDKAEQHYGLALIQMMRGRFNNAIESLSLAVAANPQHRQALGLLGDLQLKIGQYEEAAATLEQLLGQEPDNLSAVTWLSLAYHRLGKKGKTLARQSILQRIAPDLVSSLNG